jgi:putative inorganic carbon (hco3(-)) transporter
MPAGRLLQAPSFLRIAPVVVAVIVSLAAGMSGLVYSLPYAPLVVGGAITAAVAGIAWFRKPVWALYTALFVVLLPIGLIPPSIHSILNRSMTVVALATWLFDVLTRHLRVHWTSTATLMLGFAAWSTVTLLWAGNLSMGMTMVQAYVLRLILFLFLIPNEIRTRHSLNGLMTTLALNGWVLMAVSAGTVLLEGYTPGTRLKVLGMNENEMGILALVTMIGVLWQAAQPSQRHQRLKVLASWTFLLGTIALVAMSGSRGSAISLGVTLLAFCFWKPTRAWGLLSLLVMAPGAIILAPFFFSTTLERFATEEGGTLLGGREALWQAAMRLFLDHPWGGVGIGNAPYAALPYVRLLRSVLEYKRAVLHSPPLTILTETGILGTLLYLGVLGSAAWSFARRYFRSRRSGSRFLAPYFALVSSVFLGYMASWIKGGGMESDYSYFLMLGFLLIPSCMRAEVSGTNQTVGFQEVDRRMSKGQGAHPEPGLL